MSSLKLVELDIKGKKFASRKIRRIKWTLRILAVIIILGCIGASAWFIYNALNPQPQPQVQVNPTPTPVPTPEQPVLPAGGEVPGGEIKQPSEFDGMIDITKQLISDESEGKKAYLTFDDGPSANTRAILDILNRYNIKATFFLMGYNAEIRPELVMEIFNNGHAIANHSYTHIYDKVYKDADSFWLEVDGAETAIENIIGTENVQKLFRFPGGSFDEHKKQFIPLLEMMGYKYVDWNALNGDAEGGEFTAEKSMAYIEEYCTDTGNVIVLMHDTKTKDVTVETLPQIIEYLQAQGYIFDKITVN